MQSAWNRWTADAVANHKINPHCVAGINLTAWHPQLNSGNNQRSGVLTISCDNAAFASQINHLQASIVAFLNSQQEITKKFVVSSLKVRIRPTNHNTETPAQPESPKQPEEQRAMPSENSLGAIDSAISHAEKASQNQAIDARLAKSLSNLAATLRNLRPY